MLKTTLKQTTENTANIIPFSRKHIPKAKEPLHESPVKTAEYYIYEHQKVYSYSK